MTAQPIPVTFRMMPASAGSGNGPMRVTLPALPGQADGYHIPGLRRAPADQAAPPPAQAGRRISDQAAAFRSVLRAITEGNHRRAEIYHATPYSQTQVDRLMSALNHRGLITSDSRAGGMGRPATWHVTDSGAQLLRQHQDQTQ